MVSRIEARDGGPHLGHMGGANVGAMFYNAELPVERYNMPDTLKAQHIAQVD